MRIRIITAAVGGMVAMGVGTTALAGSGVMAYEGVESATCRAQLLQGVRMQNCNPGYVLHAAPADPRAAVGSYTSNPYGYLKTVEYKNTQNVNVMRIRAHAPLVGLDDVPTGYRGGCDPATTGYCRAGAVRPPVMARPVMRPRIMVAPAPRSVRSVPQMSTGLVQYGHGYDPSKFAPRQYGSTAFVPGIANIPTSIVDRSPITHIDGVPQPQPIVHSVTTARQSGPAVQARPAAPQGRVLGYVNGGSYTTVTPGKPDYWEKTSGATVVGGLPATQILCRRAGTPPTSRTVNVRRPVIGVPTPVPTPVPVPVCAGPRPAPVDLPPMAGGRWTY